MYKIRKIKFQNHPVLSNLELDFCDVNGKAVDTVIIAGENGMGKSALINELYKIASHTADSEMVVEFSEGARILTLKYYLRQFPNRNPAYILYVQDGQGMNTYSSSDDIKNRYPFGGVFSDVDINFQSQDISTVTSLDLDLTKNSRRSTTDLPKQINQLLVDIQALDDTSLATAVRSVWQTGAVADEMKLGYDARMPRFVNAFNKVFDNLSYSRVVNKNNHKSILFQKNGSDIPIEKLSSGEKQIVYRGCFLLKDINAINGAFVFIDEPEISLHPTWQMKIMDYYKGIFTNSEGIQTSQIFAVTHSPFIIHNDNRKNDKVIVLARNENGEIIVKDKPEYFKCNSLEAVKDAFSIRDFSEEKSVVYLEGRTDEKYFKKAVEVFGYNDLPFEFKWIGYIDEKGQEANTGKDALNKAVPFLTSRCLATKNVCLYDCDTNKPQKEENNVITISIPKFDNDRKISIGIENALVFGDLDIEEYRKQRVEFDGYGIEKRIPDFRKMECCDYICSLDNEQLKQVFINLKAEIDTLIKLFGDK